MDFYQRAVVQDWRDAPHQELSEPVGIHVLLEVRAGSPSGGGTGDAAWVRCIGRSVCSRRGRCFPGHGNWPILAPRGRRLREMSVSIMSAHLARVRDAAGL